MSDKAIMFDMTNARKTKFKAVSSKVVDLLRAEFDDPIKAYMLMKFVLNGMERLYDIKGSLIYGKDKEAHA